MNHDTINEMIDEFPIKLNIGRFMTVEYLKALYLNVENLKYAAATFITKIEKEKLFAGCCLLHSPNADEVEFDIWNQQIIWKYESNSACHCHPRMRVKEQSYPIADFLKWISENNVEITQYTKQNVNE